MKKQKGMTLVEIVVSLAIYALFTMLIAQVMTLVNLTIRSTNSLNRQLSYESRYADNLLTADGTGSDFAAQTVEYRVRYDGTWDTAADRWDSTPKLVRVNPFVPGGGGLWSAYNESDPRNVKEGVEYVTHTPNGEVVNQDLNDDVGITHNAHYRFMRFTTNVRTPGSYPGPDFPIYIRIVPYYTRDEADPSITDAQKRTWILNADNILSKMETITITNFSPGVPFDSGNTTEVINGPFTYGQNPDLIIHVHNAADPIVAGTQEIHGDIKLQVDGKIFDNSVQKWTETPITFYQFVQVGTSEANRTFYDKCVIEYNLNEKSFLMMDSMTPDQDVPDLPNYDDYR